MLGLIRSATNCGQTNKQLTEVPSRHLDTLVRFPGTQSAATGTGGETVPGTQSAATGAGGETARTDNATQARGEETLKAEPAYKHNQWT